MNTETPDGEIREWNRLYEAYQYAIAQLNVVRAHMAIAIDKWDKEILLNGPCEEVCNLYNSAQEKLLKIEAAIKRLNTNDYEIIEANGICHFCKCPLDQCQSDHK